ncbi:hypothetical protein LINPERPRIM_LOCUS33084 [Linum perenne]
MISAAMLQVSNHLAPIPNFTHSFRDVPIIRRHIRLLPHVSMRSHFGVKAAEKSISSIESIGSAAVPTSVLQHSLTQHHVTLLTVITCTAAVSATWVFLSAIPTLLAFQRAVESHEKLMDVTREELPNTMAAIRLSGMEISDLTMELSDLGQEITQGVKGSTRVVHVAEEKLRGLVNMDSAPSASLQGVRIPGTKKEEPGLARSARGLKEGIVKGRSLFQLFLTLASFTRLALGYFAKRAKRRTVQERPVKVPTAEG